MHLKNEPADVPQPRRQEQLCIRKVTVLDAGYRLQSEPEERRMRAAFDALVAEIARQEIFRAKEEHG